jgi:DeoR family transcriptional regulator, suf operon transcriptional repressor
MAWWQRQFGKSTRGRIVALLRRGERSVEELAAALELTDNAVRAQLVTLEKDGLVRAAGVRRDGAVGKPATVYTLAEESAPIFSSAYAHLLSALLMELSSRVPPAVLESALRDAGRRLAPARHPRGSYAERVRAGAGLLADLGADADLVRVRDGYEIRGHGCVVSEAVSACPATCRAVEALLSEITGATVTEHCDRSKAPSCRFHVASAPTTG